MEKNRSVTPERAALSVFGCVILLCAIKLVLHTVGLARTLRLARGQRSVEAVRLDTINEIASMLSRNVATAGAFLPGRYGCLEQSLALFYWLRRIGINADLRVGV